MGKPSHLRKKYGKQLFLRFIIKEGKENCTRAYGS